MAHRPSGPSPAGHEWLFYLLLIAAPLLLVVAVCSFLFKKPFIKSLRGKHVFITGGSSGIGLAIGRRALMEGASVTLISRSASNLSSAVDYLLHKVPGAQKELIRCEVADVADFEALSNAIERSYSWRPIDVFVCNAGLTRGGYLGDGQLRDVQITVQTNFMGVVNALHSALPHLKLHSRTQPVSVVIMASLASMFFMYGHAVYTATKYAMRGLAEGLRFELLPYNIRVSLICPGFTSTPFLDEAEREEEICELLKWVNLYFRKWAESADGVAAFTVAAVKKGNFLVTTSALGFVLATLGRGFVPCQSFVRLAFELFFFIPFRISSVVVIPIFRWIICHKSRAPMSAVSLQDVVPVPSTNTLDDNPTAATRTGTCSSPY